MLKRTLIVAASLAVAVSASAGTYSKCKACGPKLMDGFYIGAGFGRDVANDYVKVVRTQTNVQEGAADVGLEGVEGSLFTGYGHSWDKYFAALELHASLSSKDSTLENFYYIHRIKMLWNWGIDVLPGYNITDAIRAYGRVGYAGGQHSVRFTMYDTQKHYLNGLRFGGGIQVAVLDNVSFRLDYAHTRWDNHCFKLGNDVATEKSYSFRPNTDQVEAGASYHFG